MKQNSGAPKQGASAAGNPAQLRFAASKHIAPSFHVGPRSYAAGGVILHPLHNHPATGAALIAPQAPAGAGTIHGAVADMLQFHPHPFTINGRQPG